MSDAPSLPAGWPALSFAEATARLTAEGSPFAMSEIEIRGVRTRIWTHAPTTMREVFLAGRAHGERTFLVHEGERVSFEAFSRATLALAHALGAEGIGPGDRVAIAMRNLPEWPVAFFATLLVGAVAVPLNAWWTGPELQYALQDSGAALVVADAERWERIAGHAAACPALRRALVSRTEAAPDDPLVRRLEDLVGEPGAWAALAARALPEIALAPEDPATIFYTSGTSGNPKGALGTQRSGACNTLAHGYSLARSMIRRGEALPQPDPTAPQKASLLSIPLFHVTGCFSTLLSALHRGSRLVMMRRWDLERALEIIERERCTTAGGVPTIAWQLIEGRERGGHDLSALETISYGGAPAPAELVRRLRAAFPKAQPATGWGMTETSATFTHHQAEDYVSHPESAGPPLPICDARVVDDRGRTLPPGEIGELLVKGPVVVAGYWNAPEATAAAFKDGWLATGDLARIDPEGFITIVDRAKDMLIRGGENIYCAEVEGALHEHPAVVDAAVVAIPHPTLGEEPGAVVSLTHDRETTEAELRDFVRARIAAFKVPVRILVWPELLPRNPNGKILKSELRRLFADQPD